MKIDKTTGKTTHSALTVAARAMLTALEGVDFSALEGMGVDYDTIPFQALEDALLEAEEAQPHSADVPWMLPIGYHLTDTDGNDHGTFETLEEAKGAAAFDSLRDYDIDDPQGNRVFECRNEQGTWAGAPAVQRQYSAETEKFAEDRTRIGNTPDEDEDDDSDDPTSVLYEGSRKDQEAMEAAMRRDPRNVYGAQPDMRSQPPTEV